MAKIVNNGAGPAAQGDDELAQSLIKKLVDIGKMVRENAEQIKNLADQTTMVQELSQGMERQRNSVEALAKDMEMMGQGMEMLSKEVEKLGKGGEMLGKAMEAFGKKVDGFGELVKKSEDAVISLRESKAIPVAHIEALRLDMSKHKALFEKPLQKDVHYRHFLGRPILVLGGLFLLMLGLIFLWDRARWRAEGYSENDIRWRYVKLTQDSLVSKELNEAERVYQANPDQFRKDVVAEEERRQELYEKWLQVQQRYGEIDELEKQGKKK